mgnify:FL=1
MTHTYAYCFQSGEIEFGPRVPNGALPIVDGPDADVHRVVTANARLAYDNETWLVPGIPEGEGEGDEKLDALFAFRDRVFDSLQRIYEEEGADD